MTKLSHVDEGGKAAMVDVSGKEPQLRIARATGKISLASSTLPLIAENAIKKGDVLCVAEIAGIQAAKRASELIPLCHPLRLTDVKVKASPESDGVVVETEVRCVDRTGAEMEALTAAAVALLTVYDMCKAADKNMRIGEISLVEKSKHDIA
ncbi:MAG: cyclic pyranopterin monophosphate synthase MoaC [bacterium]|jgi:cyclic pyranopterin phosphate synthase